MNNLIKAKFLRKQEIANNTWQFVFVRPKDFVFRAGQYTTIFLGKENRDFTICAKEDDEKYFCIVTKLGISVFKKMLFEISEGSTITMKEPSGGFILGNNKNPKVFLAGGIGVTVFYSIIASNKTTEIPVTLIASFSKKEDMVFYSELQKIEKENKNIHIVYTLSQQQPTVILGKNEVLTPESEKDRSWSSLHQGFDRRASQDDKFETGRISKKHIRKYIPNFQQVEFMVAGGEKMVEDTQDMLLKMKIPAENIRIDIFTGY